MHADLSYRILAVEFIMQLLTLNADGVVVLEYGLIGALVTVAAIWAQI